MASRSELAVKYLRKFKPTVFDSGIPSRLPDAYRKFYNEWRNTPPQPVHYVPYTGKTWVRNPESGEVRRFQDVPLPLLYPKELHDVFIGGEAVVQGFIKKTKYSSRAPKFWVPRIYRSVIYSEILDKHLSALMTKRTVDLIHMHRGLDSYLLKTKACDLVSLIALKVKKKLLLALSDKDLPYDEDKNKEIYEKYEKYLIPREEIEWYGLSIGEACTKLTQIEEAEKLASIVPLKQVYRAQLIEELKRGKLEQPNKEIEAEDKMKTPLNWLKKIPGLSKNTRNS